LLRPAYPGQLRAIRKNIFSVLFALDLTQGSHLRFIEDTMMFISREVPIRFGIIPLVGKSDVASLMAKAYLVGKSKLNKKVVRDFLQTVHTRLTETSATHATEEDIQKAFASVTGKDLAQMLSEEDVSEESVANLADFGHRFAISENDGAMFINGKYLDLNENYQQSLISQYYQHVEFLQNAVYISSALVVATATRVLNEFYRPKSHQVLSQKISDSDNIYDYFFSLSNVYSRRNPLIFVSDSQPLKMISPEVRIPASVDGFPYLWSDLGENGAETTIFVVADFATPVGVGIAIQTLKFLRGTTSVRVAFIHSAQIVDGDESRLLVHEASAIVAGQYAASPKDGLSALLASLEALPANEIDVQKSEAFACLFGKKGCKIQSPPALQVESATEGDVPETADKEVDEEAAEIDEEGRKTIIEKVRKSNLWKGVNTFTVDVVGISSGETAVVINGRVVGPIPAGFKFVDADFDVLFRIEQEQRIKSVAEKVIELVNARTNDTSSVPDRVSAIVAGAAADLESSAPWYTKSRPRRNYDGFKYMHREGCSIIVGDEETAVFHIVALLDPVSIEAQQLSTVFETLSKLERTYMRIYFNPVLKLEEMPVKRFYRFVLKSEPAFDEKTGRMLPAKASFNRIPTEPLLTLGLDVIGAWVVTPTHSVQDLDNIKLMSLQGDLKKKGVEATFELKNILVEGHARDVRTMGPPRGLQFILGTEPNPELVDTITMANLGYLQLKANPGVWILRLREGRSRKLYDIESVPDSLVSKSTDNLVGHEGARIVVNSFEGVTMFPRVRKKPGMENEDVLEPESSEESPNIWDTIKSKLFGTPQKPSNTTINIFSVASGHLYERFLSIMIVSVMKHTKSPVKFWLIENFLSPSFKDFIPKMAERYEFEYELVTYKWPHWLRAQTEKQRTIWGYKILFLDVLFPLSLDKVIFVDADQVVRTDMKELVDLDLQGAVYGYTPFCDSREEIEGFRFWKQGYWKNHLQGKPYHISALYVVDLNRFRQIAAGDRLRGQYQMLSADPNSLSNLDQDLPNNMIHQLPIFSLPQEWLWCETWCSDESLKSAKTIDLCNNPMTKEPKLDRAKRILPEWESYDDEIAALHAELSPSSTSVSAVQTEPATSVQTSRKPSEEVEPKKLDDEL
ncbi:hypothetical protein HK102_004021, partial [Quaeritorhiza haematococci]